MGFHLFLQGIFPTQGSNPGLLHSQVDSLPSEPPGKSQAGEGLNVTVGAFMVIEEDVWVPLSPKVFAVVLENPELILLFYKDNRDKGRSTEN